jgi:hypothetical protein
MAPQELQVQEKRVAPNLNPGRAERNMSQINGIIGQWNGSIADDAEMYQLLHPSRSYARPRDVVADERLTVDERRAVLASWASDACAVDSNPTLRQPLFADAPVTFDEIMEALRQLDRLKGRTTLAVNARGFDFE